MPKAASSKRVATVSILFACLFASAFVCIKFTSDPHLVAALWPANAILLAFVIRGQHSVESALPFFAGALVVLTVASILAGRGPATAAAFAVADIVEVTLALWLLKKFDRGAPSLSRIGDLRVLIGVAVLIAPIVGATISASAAFVGGASWLRAWLISFGANSLGFAIVAPFLLVATADQWQKIKSENRVAEVIGFAVLIGLIAILIADRRSLIFLAVPAVILATLRFGATGAAVATFAIGCVVSGFIVAGVGTPVLRNAGLSERLIAFQLFLAAVSLASAAVAAALSERDWLLKEISQAKALAEGQIGLAVEAAGVGTWNWDLGTDQLVLSDRVKEIFGLPLAPEPSRAAVRACIHPDDREIFQQGFQRCIDENKDQISVEYRLGAPDESPERWVRSWGRVDRDQSGKILGVQGVILEISDQKRAALEREVLLRRLIEAQEQERFRLSHELHDQTGQDIAALMIELKGIEAVVSDDVRLRVHRLRALLDTMSTALDRVTWALRPTTIDDLGLAEALDMYVTDWSNQYEVESDFMCDHEVDSLPEAYRITIFRIVQESLTNIIKHANGVSTVSITIHRDDMRQWHVTIEDNGPGFDTKLLASRRGKGAAAMGITGMRERVSMIDGEFEIESSIGRGTTVFVRFPVPAVPT